MLEVRVIRACAGHFRYRVPPASRGRQEPPQAVEFLPWDALSPPVCGVPGGQALRYGTRAPAHSRALNLPCWRPGPGAHGGGFRGPRRGCSRRMAHAGGYILLWTRQTRIGWGFAEPASE